MPRDVFVSYSSQDKPVADAICACIEESGVEVWIAPRNILPPRSYGEAIIDAIAAARQDFAAINQHGADGDFAGFGGGARFFECQLHEFLIAHGFVTENITLFPALNALPDSRCSTGGENP